MSKDENKLPGVNDARKIQWPDFTVTPQQQEIIDKILLLRTVCGIFEAIFQTTKRTAEAFEKAGLENDAKQFWLLAARYSEKIFRKLEDIWLEKTVPNKP